MANYILDDLAPTKQSFHFNHDAAEDLSMTLAKVSALVEVMFEIEFAQCGCLVQHHYIWALLDLVNQARYQFDQINTF